MKLTRYRKYKDSGLSWLCEIPSHWENKRFKEWIKSISGGGTPSTIKDHYWNGDIPWVSAKDVKTDFIDNTEDYITEIAISESSTNLIQPDKVLMVVRSGILKHTLPVAINRVEVALNQDMKAFEPNKYLLSHFLFWKLKGQSRDILAICQKVGATVESIELSSLLVFPFAVPPKEEQAAIINFLNKKTSKIDKKIELLQAKRSGYQELRKTLINDAVTKGIDRNVELKDSGIGWVGKIPKDWHFDRFGDKFKLNKLKNTNLDNKNLLSLSYGKIKRKDINSSFGLLPESFETYQVVKKGDIILRLTDLQNDWNSLRVGLVNEEDGIITSAYVGLKLSKHLYPNFIYYLLHNYDIKKVFYSQGGSIRQSMKFADIKTLPLIFPGYEKQKAIATYLDDKISKIDQVISIIDKNIETLAEFKKTLINNAVTGKIKVA